MGLTGTDYQSYLETAAIRLESLFPATLTVDGTDYAATCAGVMQSEDVEPGGFDLSGSWNVRVRKSLLATAPAIGDEVDLDGTTLRVLRVNDREFDIAWTLELENLR